MNRLLKLFSLSTLFLAASLLVACNGDRVTWFDRTTPDGIAAGDGTLVRKYDVTRMEAYDQIMALCKAQSWTVKERDSDEYTAEIDARTGSGARVEFDVWSPPGKPTSIGIDHDDGRIEEAKTFALLEPHLGKRVDTATGIK